MFDNSDDYDFNPSGSSKLASLFDDTLLSGSLNNTTSSLTYTAPKQPKTKRDLNVDEPSKNKPQTSVLCAKIVSLWNLDDKDYKSLGKHGLAVIGLTDLNLFEIIGYREKNNILLRRKINATCTVYKQKDNFSSFYDNENHNWLVKFESTEDQNVFCQTALNYGAKIINTDQIPQSGKSSMKSANVATAETTVNKLLKNETLTDTIPSLDKEVEINSDSSGSQKRATILSRMAKMGQQILPSPLLKNTSTDISDSELDDSKNDRKALPKKFRRTVHIEKTVSPKEEKLLQSVPQNCTENQMVPSQNNNFTYAVQQFPQNNITTPVLYSQPIPYDGFNNFIVAQNTELKMNLAQISAKLDNVLSQGTTSCTKTDDRTLKSKVKALELKCENLQEELAVSERKYNILKTTYKDLEDKCKKDSENETYKSVIQKLNDEIDKLKLDIKVTKEKIIDQDLMKIELEECKNNIKDNEKIINVQKLKLKDVEVLTEENKSLQVSADGLNKTILDLKEKLRNSEEYYNKTEAEKQKHRQRNEKIISVFSDKIKEHMNNMYQSILVNFDEGSSYSMANINLILAQNLKAATFKIIEDLKNSYKNEAIECTLDI